MKRHSLHVLILTETHLKESTTYCIDQHAFYFSSSKTEGTGVGVIIAPHFRPYIAAVIPHDDRNIELQVATRGLSTTVIGTYAPHQGPQHDEHREEYWETLSSIIAAHPLDAPVYVLGDFNTRLIARRQEEMHIIGPHIFGQGLAHLEGTPQPAPTPQPNREHMLELATERNLVIANTFRTPKLEHRASFREIRTARGTSISPEDYTQLDHVLVTRRWLSSVHHTRTFPYQEWDSNHYLMTATIRVRLGSKRPDNTPKQKLRYSDPDETVATQRAEQFNDKVRELLANNRFAALAS